MMNMIIYDVISKVLSMTFWLDRKKSWLSDDALRVTKYILRIAHDVSVDGLSMIIFVGPDPNYLLNPHWKIHFLLILKHHARDWYERQRKRLLKRKLTSDYFVRAKIITLQGYNFWTRGTRIQNIYRSFLLRYFNFLNKNIS